MSNRQHSVPAAADLERLETACRELIETRFADKYDCGAAAVLVDDGSVLTGTSPDFPNPSTTVCHETEPYLAAFRLSKSILASLCLHRGLDDRYVVLSPCGICRERLIMHGADALVGVPAPKDATQIEWVRLEETLPYYWRSAFD